MKIPLKDFQTGAVHELLEELDHARSEVKRGGRRQAVVLSSVTGSGKTMIATALMERLIEESDASRSELPPTFLWITDQPDLNEQTRRKILATSTVFGQDDVVTVQTDFLAEVLDPGKIYFVNTQKLSKTSNLVGVTDEHPISFWETITATVEARGQDFLVIVDEAHKGMAESATAAGEAQSTVQKFIKGSPGEIPPMPLIVGITATPDRFHALVKQVPKLVSREVVVDVELVRESGLIKDKVILHRPLKKDSTDWSMLQAAVVAYKAMSDEWASYSQDQDLTRPVRPVLLVQVQDGSGKKATATDMVQTMAVLESVLGPLSDDEICHAFQEGQTLAIGGREVRRVPPPDIQGDDDIRVVFFKMSLNTGWDCPRAEIMMSFRRAVDYTAIAQLVGRMVRTPLADNVKSKPLLDTVGIYLPNFDKAAVDLVIKRLEPTGEDAISSEVDRGEDFIPELTRRSGTDEMFTKMESLSTYYVTRIVKIPNIRRVVALGRYLTQDEVSVDAAGASVALVVDALVAALNEHSSDAGFLERLSGAQVVEVRSVSIRFGLSGSDSLEPYQVSLHQSNLDDHFAWCKRRLGEGLHLAYAKDRVASGVSISEAKRELFVLLNTPGVWESINEKARVAVGAWLAQYQPVVAQLPEAAQANYRRIWQTATVPEPGRMSLPPSITGTQGPDEPEKHLYVDGAGKYPCKLSGWERPVLDGLLASDKIKGWYRNPPRLRERSFAVNYRDDAGEQANMFPDFLMFRDEGSGLVVDIVEPHRADEGDAPYKIVGLAEYAARHGHEFGRIEMISKIDGKFRSINLNEEATCAAARTVNNPSGVARLFKDYGR